MGSPAGEGRGPWVNNRVVEKWIPAFAGKGRPKPGLLFALPLAWAAERRHHAVQRAQLLLGAAGALEEIAQIAHHRGTLFRVAHEAAAIELFLEMLEEAEQMLLIRWHRMAERELLGR